MLFNVNKQTNSALLKIVIALFILLAPSLLGLMPVSAVTYLTFAVFWGLAALRIKTNEKAAISINHAIYILLAAYAVLSLLWVNNREGQLIYLFILGGIMAFFSVASDYFAENSPDTIKRRIMYLLSFSGIICAIFNIVYWILYIVPVAGESPFSLGVGNNNFLALFMFLCIIGTVYLMKGNSKFRKFLLFSAALVMAFVFIMAKSVAAWAFAVILTVLMILKNKVKSKKIFAVISLGGVISFLIVIICVLSSTVYGTAFKDVFSYGTKHIFGAGGGFWSGRETFSSFNQTDSLAVGLLPYLYASSGLLGLLCGICIIVKSIVFFLRLRTWESLTELFICIAVMLLPFGENLTVILFWIGLSAYNEYSAGMNLKLQIRKSVLEKTLYTIAALIIIACVLFALSVIRINARAAYKNKDYSSSYSLFKIAGTINFADSESCRMAVASIRKLENVQNQRDEALAMIDRAIKRDSDNLENVREKALVYDACGEYELSAQQYRDASQRAFVKDKYNLYLAKELYKIVKKYPKGSSETKRAYEEIVLIAQATVNLDSRKEINDIADKALGYTKGELGSEG